MEHLCRTCSNALTCETKKYIDVALARAHTTGIECAVQVTECKIKPGILPKEVVLNVPLDPGQVIGSVVVNGNHYYRSLTA